MGLPKEATQDKKERQNSWQQMEETLLFGAICEKWFSTGALHPARGGENKGKVWETIKKIHDKMKENLRQAKVENVGVDRTFSALERHYKVMKKKYAKDPNRKGSSKLCLSDIYSMYEFKVKEIKEKYGILLFSQEDMDEIIPDTKGEAVDSTSAGRKNSWKRDEERLLVYCAFQKFIEKGSFNSAKSDGDDLCWESILKLFQQGLKFLYPNEQNTRTANALSRHFRVMKKDEWKKKSDKTLKQLYQECVQEFARRSIHQTFNSYEQNFKPFHRTYAGDQLSTVVKSNLQKYDVKHTIMERFPGISCRKRNQHAAMLQQNNGCSVPPNLRGPKAPFNPQSSQVFAPISMASPLASALVSQTHSPSAQFVPAPTYGNAQSLMGVPVLGQSAQMTPMNFGNGYNNLASNYPGVNLGSLQGSLFNPAAGLFNAI